MEILPINTKFNWLLRDLPKGKGKSPLDYILAHKDKLYATCGRVLIRIPCQDIPDGLYDWNALGLIPSDTKSNEYHVNYDDEINAIRLNHVEIVGSDSIGLGIACYLTSQGITLNWMRGDGDILRRIAGMVYDLKIHSGGYRSVLFESSDIEIVFMAADETAFSYRDF